MYNHVARIFLFIFSIIALAGASQAATVSYDFSAVNFGLIFPDNPPSPITSITGSFAVDANNLVDIDLEIDGHTYSTDEVAYTAYDLDQFILSGRLNGINSIYNKTNDFELYGSLHGPILIRFTFSSSNSSYIYRTYEGSLTLSPPAVPIPSAAFLFGSGFFGLIGAARKRR